MQKDHPNAAVSNKIGSTEPGTVRRLAAVRIVRQPQSSPLPHALHMAHIEGDVTKDPRSQVCKIPAERAGSRVPWTSLVIERKDVLYWLHCCYCKINATWFRSNLPH